MGKRSNGEGTIFKRKDGRWCAAYFDENYSRHYVYGKTQGEEKGTFNKTSSNFNFTGMGVGIFAEI